MSHYLRYFLTLKFKTHNITHLLMLLHHLENITNCQICLDVVITLLHHPNKNVNITNVKYV